MENLINVVIEARKNLSPKVCKFWKLEAGILNEKCVKSIVKTIMDSNYTLKSDMEEDTTKDVIHIIFVSPIGIKSYNWDRIDIIYNKVGVSFNTDEILQDITTLIKNPDKLY